MVMGSEGEGGTQMHSVKKIGLRGKAEIVVNKQTGLKPGNHIYQGHRQKARELSARTRKGGSKPESQCNDKHNRKTKHKQYTG